MEDIRRLGFFRDFAGPEVRRLLRLGVRRSIQAGDLLATEGTRKQRRVLYVVLAGGLEYVRHLGGTRTSVALRLEPGDVGGFLTFFNDAASPVSVRSAGPSEVLEIGRPEFARLLAEQPALAARLLFALLRMTVAHTEALLTRQAATAEWALDLERHLRQLPLHRGW
ncbi:MAG: cyclic nucleotide-binding domain-containing protein [Candidatus Methylomirabilales bacterium]